MRFSQEQMDDTIIPKVDIFDMSMKNKSKLSKEVGDAIMRESAKITDVAKSATTETFKIIDDEVTLTLSTGYLNKNLISVDFCDEPFKEYFEMDLNRKTLKGLAEFILNYLEQYQ